jgi:hypothetical protein
MIPTLDKCSLLSLCLRLCPRELLKHGLDHPARLGLRAVPLRRTAVLSRPFFVWGQPYPYKRLLNIVTTVSALMKTNFSKFTLFTEPYSWKRVVGYEMPSQLCYDRICC